MHTLHLISPPNLLRSALLAVVLSLLAIPRANAALLPAEPEHVRSLDGTWRFKLEQPGDVTSPPTDFGRISPITTPATFEPFYTPEYKEGDGWHNLAVPANWEMAGYSPATYNQPDNASAFYRLWFKVPAAWKGRRVFVHFDGVQNGAEVWLNGQPVAVDEPSGAAPTTTKAAGPPFRRTSLPT